MASLFVLSQYWTTGIQSLSGIIKPITFKDGDFQKFGKMKADLEPNA
ncbi:MAG: hypothetical protein IPO94_08790 [Saprospiraceae bacterium]|nr:hypothetical protein [Saprospiraceae bacterium]